MKIASSDEEANVWHIERDHGIANRQQNKEFIRKALGLQVKFKAPVDEDEDMNQKVFQLYVAKGIPRREWMANEEARQAVNKEWARLKAKRTWLEPNSIDEVVYLADIIRRSKESGKKVHIGRLFDICVLKGSELADGDPNKKHKGRVVFGGNNVRDEYGLALYVP